LDLSGGVADIVTERVSSSQSSFDFSGHDWVQTPPYPRKPDP
jgi:hypothetical protein